MKPALVIITKVPVLAPVPSFSSIAKLELFASFGSSPRIGRLTLSVGR